MKYQKRANSIDLAARSRARRRGLQALYAWQLSGNSMAVIIDQFRQEQEMEIADLDYFEDLLRGVEKHCNELDNKVRTYLDREMAEVDHIERAVLRLAAYELLYRLDVPYRVVLNEAIEVTKRFGAEQSHTYVNGVLDKAATAWRAPEKLLR